MLNKYFTEKKIPYNHTYTGYFDHKATHIYDKHEQYDLKDALGVLNTKIELSTTVTKADGKNLTSFEAVAEGTLKLYDDLKSNAGKEDVNNIPSLLEAVNALQISDLDGFNYCLMLKFKLAACTAMQEGNLTGRFTVENLTAPEKFVYAGNWEQFMRVNQVVSFAEAEQLREMERASADCTIL
jgi:hypothetical protein